VRGREYALPEDLKEIAHDVLRHRLVLSYEALADGVTADDIIDRILQAVPVPELALRERMPRSSA
jgi:MoxR-like ATPase